MGAQHGRGNDKGPKKNSWTGAFGKLFGLHYLK